MGETFAISHGWSSGKWHTKRFREALIEAGFRPIKNIAEADIIIAHSAGCYKLPKELRAKLIVLIGVPYWPSQSILARLFRNKRADWSKIITQQGFWYAVQKLTWQAIYVILKPGLTFIGFLNHKRLHFFENIKDKRVILIRNEEDNLSSPDLIDSVKHYKNVHYVKMPGVHDDYYTNPKPYVDLILKHL